MADDLKLGLGIDTSNIKSSADQIKKALENSLGKSNIFRDTIKDLSKTESKLGDLSGRVKTLASDFNNLEKNFSGDALSQAMADSAISANRLHRECGDVLENLRNIERVTSQNAWEMSDEEFVELNRVIESLYGNLQDISNIIKSVEIGLNPPDIKDSTEAVESLDDAFNTTTADIDSHKAVDAEEAFVHGINEARADLEDFNETIAETASNIPNDIDIGLRDTEGASEGIASYIQKVIDARNKLAELQQFQNDVFSGEQQISDSDFVQLQNDIRNANNELERAGIALQNYKTGIEAIANIPWKIGDIGAKFSSVRDAVSSVSASFSDRLSIAMDKARENAIVFSAVLQSELQRGAIILGTKFPNAFRTVTTAMDNFEDGARNVGEVVSYAFGNLLQKFPQIGIAINNLKDGAQNVKEVLRGIGSVAGESATNIIAKFRSITPNLQAVAQNIKQSFTVALGSTINNMPNIIAKAKGALNSLKPVADRVTSTLSNGFKRILSTVRSLASTLLKSLKGALTKIASIFSKVKSSAESAFSQKSLKSSLTTLLKYTLGVRSLYFAFRKLRSLVKEGINNLVQYESANNQTNKAITELRTSLLYIKNAWGAAFAPVINVVYPILVKLMDLLASVGNAIARFMAALTGQANVLQAVKVGAGDYAASLSSAGGSAKKAAKDQDKLNDKLAAFDDLNVLGKDKDDDDDDTSGGGGGGIGTPSANDMFTSIATPFNQLAQLLKDAWETGDGFKVGEYIGQQLKESLDELDAWLTGEGREKMLKIANLIGTTIDGFISVDELATSIGTTLADAVILGMDMINTIVTPDRFKHIGEFIVEGVNAFIPKVLPKLGETIGNLLNSGISLAWGFIKDANFDEWGTSFGEAINNFFDQMGTKDEDNLNGWEKLGLSITGGVEGLLDMIINAINEIDVEKIKTAISDLLENIDWEGIKARLKELWDTVWEKLEELFPNVDWEGIKTNIETVFSTVSGWLSQIDLGKVHDFISKIIDKLSEIDLQDLERWAINISAAILAIKGAPLISGIGSVTKGLLSLNPAASAVAVSFGGALLGAKELGFGISELIQNKDDVVDYFKNGGEFVELYGGVSAEFLDNMSGGALVFRDAWNKHGIVGIFETISATVHNDADAIDELSAHTDEGSDFAGKWAEAWDIAQESVGTAILNMSDNWNSGVDTVVAYFDDIGDRLKDYEWSDVLGKMSVYDAFEGLGEKLTTKFGSEIETFKGGFSGKLETIHGVTDEFKQNFETVFETTKEGFGVKLENIRERAGQFKTDFMSGLDLFKTLFETNINKVISIVDTAKDNFGAGIDVIRERATTFRDNFLAGFDTFKSLFSEGIEVIKEKFDFSEAFTNMASGFRNGFNSVVDIINNFLNTLANGVNGIGSILNGLEITNPITGTTYGLNIPQISAFQIPHLAQGAVIPPNKEFMAVLGDQSHGTNIEAPLDTIKAAVGAELSPYLEQLIAINEQVIQAINNKNLSIGDREIGKANARYTAQQRVIRGTAL